MISEQKKKRPVGPVFYAFWSGGFLMASLMGLVDALGGHDDFTDWTRFGVGLPTSLIFGAVALRKQRAKRTDK